MACSRMFPWDENPSPPYLARPFAYLEQSLALMQRAPQAEIMSSHDMLNRMIVHRLNFRRWSLIPRPQTVPTQSPVICCRSTNPACLVIPPTQHIEWSVVQHATRLFWTFRGVRDTGTGMFGSMGFTFRPSSFAIMLSWLLKGSSVVMLG